MKVLGNLTVDKDSSVNYPFGANIQNETDTINGTPVIREIYGDVLMNLYRILELTNVTPNGIEDDKTTQFQLVEALKKLPNSLNDIEQVLTLSGSVWTVPFDLSILPNKYFFIARASDNYTSGTTFKGTGATEYNFTSNGFKASDELLVIIDSSNVRAYSLSKLSEAPEYLPTIIATPLRFNSTNELYYFDSGKLYKNLQVWDLQNSIRVDQSDGTLVLKNAFIMQNHVVCVVKNSSNNYEFYAFDLLDLNTVITLNTDIVQTPSVDYEPQFYANDSYLFVTNDANTNTNDLSYNSLLFDEDLYTLNYAGDSVFDASFEKDQNGTVYQNELFTLISGELNKFNLNTGVKTALGNFPAISGYLFNLNDNLYLNQTNIAHKLNL